MDRYMYRLTVHYTFKRRK